MKASLAAVRAALEPRYRVLRELGHGGMAHVYLAEDTRWRQQVAIKVLRPELTTILGPTRFRLEIEILSRLRHPNIVPLLESSEGGPPLYYVMPFISGDSLRDRLAQRGPLPLDDTLAIARDMAAAVDHAHAQGVLHRDIKPGNVLLQADRAMVCDFGIARAIETAGGESISSSGLVVGTPAYMSPEQAAGDEVDRRSDIYALACVVYEMLAGEPPFTGASAQAVLARKISGTPRSLRVVRADVPSALEDALRQALATQPAERPARAALILGSVSGG